MRDDAMPVHIDWTYDGQPDGLLGTGATAAERWLTYGVALMMTGLLVAVQAVLRVNGAAAAAAAAAVDAETHVQLTSAAESAARLPWSWWHWIIFMILGIDVIGGTVANTLNSCKRFYHTPVTAVEKRTVYRWLKQHRIFAALHIHPIVVELLFPGGTLWIGMLWYVLLLASVALTASRVPLYLQRPVAFSTIVLALLLSLYILPSAPGLEWFIPLLFVKIVYGHSVREEPYRPISRSAAAEPDMG